MLLKKPYRQVSSTIVCGRLVAVQKGTLKLRREVLQPTHGRIGPTSVGEFVDYPREEGAPSDNQI